MMARKKLPKSKKINVKRLTLIMALLVVFLLAAIMRLKPVYSQVAEVAGVNAWRLKIWSGIVMLYITGTILILLGLPLMVVPWVGVLMVTSGVVFILYGLVASNNWLSDSKIGNTGLLRP